MKPSLEKRSEFERILTHYQPNPDVVDDLRKLKALFLNGVSSSGRNSVIKALVDSGDYYYLISDTTRPPRENNGHLEKNGNPYWFKSENEFLEGLQQGIYVSPEIIHNQQVSAFSHTEIKRALDSKKYSLNELEYNGVADVKELHPESVVIVLLPPSYKEWIRRLERRGTMDSDEIRNRLFTAEKVLEHAHQTEYAKFVVNNDLDVAVQDVRRIFEDERYSDQEHKQALDLCWNLLLHVKQELYS